MGGSDGGPCAVHGTEPPSRRGLNKIRLPPDIMQIKPVLQTITDRAHAMRPVFTEK